jgi:hypothetical protein
MAKKPLSALKRSVAQLKDSAPPATVGAPKSKGAGTGLMIVVPPVTLKALRQRAVDTGTTTRAVVLAALSKDGIQVPPHELIDRRRKT